MTSTMSCSITLEGAEAIADIAKRAHLKDLNLYMNDIGDAGILKVPHNLLRTFTYACAYAQP